MTEAARRARRPSPALVVWGSVVLFAILFALLTYRLSASQPPAPRPELVRTVVKRRVVTTIVPSAGRNSVSSSGGAIAAAPAEAAPVVTGAS